MTQPAGPTPAAPANDPIPQNPGPAPANPADPTPSEDVAALPEWAQKQIQSLRAEAAKARTTAKQTAADEARQELTQQIAQALGLQGDEPPNPTELAAQVQQAREAAWELGLRLEVHEMAGRLGANASALLDSVAFLNSLADLDDVDPDTPDFTAALEAKVQAALEKNPNYRATGQAPAAPAGPRPDPSQGSRGNAPTPTDRSLTGAIRAHYGQ